MKKIIPFILSIFILVSDKISKAFIVTNYPLEKGQTFRFIKDVFNNGFLEIIHVRNNVVAFSLGDSLPEIIRPIVFIILPLIVLTLLIIFYYFKSVECTTLQRWAIAGITGGGLGNITDRMFPPGGQNGVVDFISVKFYGIFGMERWPTFNIADASVVVCVIIWLITILTYNPPDTADTPDTQQAISKEAK